MFRVIEEDSLRAGGPIDFTPTGEPVMTLTAHEAPPSDVGTARCV
jgi:hypothetical protein